MTTITPNNRTRTPKQTRAIQRAVAAVEKYKRRAEFLAELQTGLQECERAGNTGAGYPASHKAVRKIAQRLARKLTRLELKQRDAALNCLRAFNGYPVLPDLIRERNMDIYHWTSIARFRHKLMRPVSHQVPSLVIAMDKWERRILESYTDEQIEQELLAFCERQILGVRQQNGTTEYLLPWLDGKRKPQPAIQPRATALTSPVARSAWITLSLNSGERFARRMRD